MLEDGDVLELVNVLRPLPPNNPQENGEVDVYLIGPANMVNNGQDGKLHFNL